MRYDGPRLIDPLKGHERKSRESFGIKPPRDQDDDIRVAIEGMSNVPSTVRPRITGTGPAAVRELIGALERLGLIDDESEDDDFALPPPRTYVQIAATTTLTDGDDLVECYNTSAFTVNLPTAAGRAGRQYTINTITGGFSVVVDPSGSEVISGNSTTAATLTLGNDSGLTIASDGSNWLMVAKHGSVT
jgi:hypothetical protein